MDATNFILTTPEQLKTLVLESVAVAFQHHRPAVATATSADTDVLLTPEETAKLLKVSKVTVWDWTRRGILKKNTIGNQVRYLRSEVLEALTKKGVAA
jgi:excisionase family DNA binding protein